MTRGEFETNAGMKVSDADYEAANIVYLYHPLIKDKAGIGKFWKLGGRALIDDMLPRARLIQRADGEVRTLNTALNEAKGHLLKLRNLT